MSCGGGVVAHVLHGPSSNCGSLARRGWSQISSNADATLFMESWDVAATDRMLATIEAAQQEKRDRERAQRASATQCELASCCFPCAGHLSCPSHSLLLHAQESPWCPRGESLLLCIMFWSAL